MRVQGRSVPPVPWPTSTFPLCCQNSSIACRYPEIGQVCAMVRYSEHGMPEHKHVPDKRNKAVPSTRIKQLRLTRKLLSGAFWRKTSALS